MSKFILFISPILILLFSPSNSLLPDGNTGRSVTDCMFGPFKDAVKECMSHGWKFTGCLLENLDWLNENGSLRLVEVLESFTSHVKNQKYERRVENVIRRCVKTANSNGTDVSDKFVECLNNNNNAFAGLFPDAFCEKRTHESIISKISEVHDEFKKETEKMNDFTNCGLGPFNNNAMRCTLIGRGYDQCLLYHMGLFTEDDKVNIIELLNTIEPYIVNSKFVEETFDVMGKCVIEANDANRGRKGVGKGLIKCWHRENAFGIFKSAFCTKAELQSPTIHRPIPVIEFNKN